MAQKWGKISMNKYIDLEKYLKKLYCEINKSGKYTDYECGLDDAYAYANDMELADVEPVRHAKWIVHENHLCNSDGKSIMLLGCVYECPLCGRKEESAEPYCNCGAKMDAKEKEE